MCRTQSAEEAPLVSPVDCSDWFVYCLLLKCARIVTAITHRNKLGLVIDGLTSNTVTLVSVNRNSHIVVFVFGDYDEVAELGADVLVISERDVTVDSTDVNCPSNIGTWGYASQSSSFTTSKICVVDWSTDDLSNEVSVFVVHVTIRLPCALFFTWIFKWQVVPADGRCSSASESS